MTEAINYQLAGQLMQSAAKIQRLLSGATQNIIEAGQELIAVKAMLKHGEWGAWLRDQCELSERMAQRLMGVAERFKNDNLSDLEIAPSALYLLAAPGTPENVGKNIVTRAKAGERITHKVAHEAVKQHKPKAEPNGNSKPQKLQVITHEPTKPELITPATDGDIAKYLSAQPAAVVKAIEKLFVKWHGSLDEARIAWLNLEIWLAKQDAQWILNSYDASTPHYERLAKEQRASKRAKKAGK